MSKEDKREIAVAILPWAGLKQDIQVGPVAFWPWDPSKIQDEEIKNQLERFFKIFVDHYGKTVNTVTICSHGKLDFHILEGKEYNELRAAINILVFSSICPVVKLRVCSNNDSIAPPTAEHYDFFEQKLKIPDDRLVVVITRSSANFEDIDKVHISRPWGVSNFWGSNPSDELIGAFDKVFNDSFSSETRERLFRSLEWFRLAHTEAKNVSDASRLVMMATAFEILLDFPERQKQKSVYFAQQIENKLKKDGSITEAHQYKEKRHKCTKAACWAYDFYQLRNKIVHGGQFEPENGIYKEDISHNIVADLVLEELIVRELFENDCFGEEATKFGRNFNEFLRWRTMKNDYHKVLGWINSAEGKKK